MILVALTGGIGSGKSTVSALLAARGAVIVDADAIVRELQQAGTPLLAPPRRALRRRASSAPTASSTGRRWRRSPSTTTTRCSDLNDIVHPAVRAEIARRIDAEADDRPRRRARHPAAQRQARAATFAAVIVVDVPIEVAVERLVTFRAMDEADARARIAKQITREERLAGADRVIDNGGDLAHLEAQIDELWAWLQTLPAATRSVIVVAR